MRILAAVLMGVVFSSVAPAGEPAGLELYAFITRNGASEGSLNLRITNRGDTQQTVLTENFTMWSLGPEVNGLRVPAADLQFDIMTWGRLDKPDKWTFVPSLPKLAPVTLRKDETASATVKLDKGFLTAIENPDAVVSVRYTIGKRIAERYGLWQGTLEVKETAKSLLTK